MKRFILSLVLLSITFTVAGLDTNTAIAQDAGGAAGLYKQGKAEEVEPGHWVATLSDGTRFGINIDPEMLSLSDTERKEFMKKQFDEINELRKTGKYERTFIKEVEENGVKIRLYEDRFTLSNGKVITIGTGEAVKDDNKD